MIINESHIGRKVRAKDDRSYEWSEVLAVHGRRFWGLTSDGCYGDGDTNRSWELVEEQTPKQKPSEIIGQPVYGGGQIWHMKLLEYLDEIIPELVLRIEKLENKENKK